MVHLLIEGGAETLRRFEPVVNRMVFYLNPTFVMNEGAGHRPFHMQLRPGASVVSASVIGGMLRYVVDNAAE